LVTIKQFGRVLAGVGVSGCCLMVAFRSVPLHQVWTITTSIPVATVVVWTALASSSLVLRALRWRVLLEAVKPLPLGLAFAVNSAGQLGNAILPARLGDIFRGTNLGRSGVSCGFALATVLVERVLDTGFLVFISAVAIGSFEGTPAWLTRASVALGTAAAGGLSVALLLPHLESRVLSLVRCSAPERWADKLVGMVQQFVLGLRSLHDPKRLTAFFLSTCVIWFLDGCGAVLLGRGLSITLSPAVAALLLTSVALSSAVPAGNVGVYQMVTIAVLAPFGVARPQALGFAIVLQVLGLINLLAWGSVSIWYLACQVSKPVGTQSPQSNFPILAMAGAFAPPAGPPLWRSSSWTDSMAPGTNELLSGSSLPGSPRPPPQSFALRSCGTTVCETGASDSGEST
jgi:glycosyltransferase 2 family protein